MRGICLFLALFAGVLAAANALALNEDFEAEFEQIIHSDEGELIYRGELAALAAGGYFWRYAEPERKRICGIGARVVVIDDDLEQASEQANSLDFAQILAAAKPAASGAANGGGADGGGAANDSVAGGVANGDVASAPGSGVLRYEADFQGRIYSLEFEISAQPPGGQNAVTGKKTSAVQKPPGGQSAVTGKKTSARVAANSAQNPAQKPTEPPLFALRKISYTDEFGARTEVLLRPASVRPDCRVPAGYDYFKER